MYLFFYCQNCICLLTNHCKWIHLTLSFKTVFSPSYYCYHSDLTHNIKQYINSIQTLFNFKCFPQIYVVMPSILSRIVRLAARCIIVWHTIYLTSRLSPFPLQASSSTCHHRFVSSMNYAASLWSPRTKTTRFRLALHAGHTHQNELHDGSITVICFAGSGLY